MLTTIYSPNVCWRISLFCLRTHYSSSEFMKITTFSVKIKQVMHLSDIDVVFLRKFKVEWLTPGNFVAFAKKHLHHVQCNCSIIILVVNVETLDIYIFFDSH